MGVQTETKTRKVHANGGKGRRVSLNHDWLAQLNLAEPGAQTVHSVSLAVKPVLVQNPAIIIQPADTILGGDD